MNYDIIPTLASEKAVERHEDKEAWMTFSRRTARNPFLKEYLRIRENDRCAWCNRTYPLYGFHVHHTDYDHECRYGKIINVPNPTEKRPERTAKVADCESCSTNQPEYFQECVSKLTTVHKTCNHTIEIVRGKLEDGTLIRR
ncbi:hypothetical protein J2T12_003947 [Paenibacillus anaericanus]|nr:hypothetical protein [Paenibacillus anaericanus]